MAEWIAKNDYLSLPEMENNARLVWAEMAKYGFTIEAIAALLANMQRESTINPGLWNSRIEDMSRAYGLVQWLPPTKYINWAGPNWRDNGPLECERINWECVNNGGGQWYATSTYNLTFEEFRDSHRQDYYLTLAFLHCYERPGDYDVEEPIRKANYDFWWPWISGQEPPGPGPGPTPGIVGKRKWWIFSPPWL